MIFPTLDVEDVKTSSAQTEVGTQTPSGGKKENQVWSCEDMGVQAEAGDR